MFFSPPQLHTTGLFFYHFKIFLCSCFQLFCFLLTWKPKLVTALWKGLLVKNCHDPLTAFVRDLPGTSSQDTVMWALFLQCGIKRVPIAVCFSTHHSNSYSLANWILCLAHSILNVWFVWGLQECSFAFLPVWQFFTPYVFGMCASNLHAHLSPIFPV